MSMHSDWRGAGAVVLCALALATVPPALCAPAEATVTLAPASVAASGIQVAPLAESRYAPQVSAIATVLDPQPLLVLSAQLLGARTALNAAAAQAHAAAAEAQRLRELYRHDENAALRDVQAADAAAATAQARQVAAAADDAAARSGARTQWGTALASRAGRGPQALSGYADGQMALLAVALPVGSSAPSASTILVQAIGGDTLWATLLGPSPRADPVVQGPTYFYRAEDTGLRSGQRLTAAVPQGAAARSGVIVPTAAVLWYAGRSWAYVETAGGHFERRPLAQDARMATGWFESSGFLAGERVVVGGAELLLSQELLPPPGAKPPSADDD